MKIEIDKMIYTRTIIYFLSVVSFLSSFLTSAQDGNQILDGIGETGLIARYLFNGDAKDWSRNNLHASIEGSGASFVHDETFGKVLSLNKSGKNFISLPHDAILQEESLSITGWVKLHTNKLGQFFFDFGKNNASRMYLAPMGTMDTEGLQNVLNTTNGRSYSIGSKAFETGQWYHIAMVINTPSKAISTYLNGELVDTANDVTVALEQFFAQASNQKNKLYIGKSITGNDSYLFGLLHDFRIYRIPLSHKQVSRIYESAGNSETSNNKPKKDREDDLQKFPDTVPQLYNAYLQKIKDVHVTTQVGHLPRLPRFVKGTYTNNIQGPAIRILWPAPKDNAQVLRPGTYQILGNIPGSPLKAKATVTVKENMEIKRPDQRLASFTLEQVSLTKDLAGNDTKFIENRDKFISTLAQTDPDAFLYMFRNAFGIAQPSGAEPLGVWNSQETKLRGHATGHYLTAIAQAYASTGYDKELQNNFGRKMEYMVNTLYKLSQMSGQPKENGGAFVADPNEVPFGPGKTAYDSDIRETSIRTDYWNWGRGFISAYPPDQFIMLEKGATYGTNDTQIWAPYYTLHKILAGLIDVYEISGNQKALEITKGMGNWIHTRLSKLPKATLIKMWNTYIAGEYGGMNEAMARLYKLTNDSRYLETAQLFDNIKMFYGDAEHTHGITKNVDTFRGLHANQHIPQIMGALTTYQASNDHKYYQVADNFWYKTTNDYMYSIGGVAGARNPTNAECFIGEPATLYENGLSSGGQNETCATYNMLKLSRNLFLFDHRAELMDYYERGLYNHILASVAEDSPANTYHVPLRPSSVKHFGNPHMKGFTCCNGTALESNTKLQNSIYFRSVDNQALYVNLYVPSTLDWTEKNISIQQATNFPHEDRTRLTVTGKGKFDLNVRVPYWATKGFFVHINGKPLKVEATPGSYLTLNRKWKNGDIIELQMPFQFHLSPIMDQQNIASLFYGPILLAAQESEPRKEWRKVTLDLKDLGKTIKGDPKKLEFSIDGTVFKPFYETYGRHSVYLDVSLK
ncbi:glycoside hydrolase family 127 protein [Maribacter confluentis]|uniref:Glycoside hydrolase family 127 protein n=1 Tax=Maribacter confluentis TaxID=1656093 RepID=A0ABT8RQU1_9FLAO|nr:beta-L-arabinofuranosidase domain-containing protein [Maribacter confluentis]MDO1512744.1 glycoside hydrolase family 127 protein [Maribacter confluentis]